jgi:hypothetical protein
MNIYTVRDNLKNTIAGKEKYVTELRQGLKADLTDGAYMAVQATATMLDININELKVILFDVEKCCEQWNLMSWEINPERMGQ